MRLRLTRFFCLLACWPAVVLSLGAQTSPAPADPSALADQPSQVDPRFADDDDYPVQPVTGVGAPANLYHKEIVGEDPKPIKGTDGFVGVLKKETDLINQVGKGKHPAKAELDVYIKPKLQRGKSRAEKSIVTLDAQQTNWTVDADIPPENQAQLETEHGYVMSKLAKWQTVLTPEQLDTLDQGKSVDFKITSPFSALGMLSHPVVVVSLSQGPKPKIAQVVVRPVKTVEVLTVGRGAVAEVTYDRPVTLPTRTVHLDAGAGTLELRAKNSGNDTVFVTDPFLLVPDTEDKSDGLPDSPVTPGPTRSR
jgi:hypothetical protein